MYQNAAPSIAETWFTRAIHQSPVTEWTNARNKETPNFPPTEFPLAAKFYQINYSPFVWVVLSSFTAPPSHRQSGLGCPVTCASFPGHITPCQQGPAGQPGCHSRALSALPLRCLDTLTLSHPHHGDGHFVTIIVVVSKPLAQPAKKNFQSKLEEKIRWKISAQLYIRTCSILTVIQMELGSSIVWAKSFVLALLFRKKCQPCWFSLLFLNSRRYFHKKLDFWFFEVHPHHHVLLEITQQ